MGVPDLFVTSAKGSSGTCMVCKANIVAEGGVFSPYILECLLDGRRFGVSFKASRADGVGVNSLSGVGELGDM